MENFKKLESVLRDTFGLDENADVTSMQFGPEPPWDSVGHAILIVAIEDAFDVTFDMDEVPELLDFPKLVSALNRAGVSIPAPAGTVPA